jgi:hypothetical protein
LKAAASLAIVLMPQPRPELLREQLVDDRRDALGRDDPAPEQVAHVRRARVDGPLLTVERERVEAAPVNPERLVETRPQLVRLTLEPLRERLVAPDFARELRQPRFAS